MHVSRVSEHISVLASDIPLLGADRTHGCLSTVTVEISSSELVLPACKIKPFNELDTASLNPFWNLASHVCVCAHQIWEEVYK